TGRRSPRVPERCVSRRGTFAPRAGFMGTNSLRPSPPAEVPAVRKWVVTALLALCALWCQPALGQKKARKAESARKALLPGERVEKKVALLTKEVNWLSSLDEASEQAREQKKAIFWLHALGDLEGDT